MVVESMKSLLTAKASTTEEPREEKFHAGICAGETGICYSPLSRSTLLKVKIQLTQRKIIHIDMDCFYAAVEVRDNPELEGKPVAVGGQPNSRSVLCTCNYEARKFGIHSAMPSSQAARLCPELVILPVRFEKYRQASHQINEIFRNYTSLIEPLSLDEAFLDVSGSSLHSGSATLIAQDIRQKIFQSQKITASAGIAPNKMLAKIASDWNKPNGQYVITPNSVAQFMINLPVKKLFGVGKVTGEKLHQFHLNTCGDIQKKSLPELIALVGNYGNQLYSMAHGIDNRKVVTERKRKSLSVENTFQNDFLPKQVPDAILDDLFTELKRRLGKSEKKEKDIKNIFIKIKFNDFTSTTAQSPCLRFSTSAFNQLFKMRIMREIKPIRLLGLGVHFNENKQQASSRQLAFDFS